MSNHATRALAPSTARLGAGCAEEVDARHAGHSATPCWYVIQCRANQNQRAQDNLENQGFTCFYPRIDIERLRAGRRVISSEPLFPGYLFIHLCPRTQSWHTIRSTRGVLKMVAFGRYPVSVPDDVIECLRHPRISPPVLRRGDRLRIETGPFADLDGIFQRFDGKERVVLLLGLLHKQHQLTLSLKHVRPL